MEMSLVDIHIPTPKTPLPEGLQVDPRLNNWGRALLATAILAEQNSVTFSRGRQAFDFDEGTVRVHTLESIKRSPRGYEVQVLPETLAIDSLKAIRNITAILGHDVPELNHGNLRAMTGDKAKTNEILVDSGLAKEFTVVNSGEEFMPKLSDMKSKALVVKPRQGKQGQNVVLGTKQELAELYESGRLTAESDLIIEERLHMGAPMPIRGINEVEQLKIDLANQNKMAKELRAYYFGKEEGVSQFSFVLRVAKEGSHHLHDDSWVFVDQDSVPDELWRLSEQVADDFRVASQQDEVHIGIDWARAETATGEPYWIPMEVNGSEPQLVYESENKDTAKQHARMLARQLSRVAEKGTTRMKSAGDTK